jgi:hypothetical protein
VPTSSRPAVITTAADGASDYWGRSGARNGEDGPLWVDSGPSPTGAQTAK